MLKIVAAFLLAAAPALAQSPVSNPLAACGQSPVSYNVKFQDPGQSHPPILLPGKAVVFFIHDAGARNGVGFGAYPTTRFAMDGRWMGADHGNSWFAVPADPGVHHICVNLQSSFFGGVELAHFTAEAGKSYYFRTRFVLSGSVEMLEITRIDSDEGRYLVQAYPMSVSTPQK